MSLYQAMESGLSISRQRACKEVKWHRGSIQKFLDTFGVHDEYSAKEIWLWLGY